MVDHCSIARNVRGEVKKPLFHPQKLFIQSRFLPNF